MYSILCGMNLLIVLQVMKKTPNIRTIKRITYNYIDIAYKYLLIITFIIILITNSSSFLISFVFG